MRDYLKVRIPVMFGAENAHVHVVYGAQEPSFILRNRAVDHHRRPRHLSSRPCFCWKLAVDCRLSLGQGASGGMNSSNLSSEMKKACQTALSRLDT